MLFENLTWFEIYKCCKNYVRVVKSMKIGKRNSVGCGAWEKR